MIFPIINNIRRQYWSQNTTVYNDVFMKLAPAAFCGKLCHKHLGVKMVCTSQPHQISWSLWQRNRVEYDSVSLYVAKFAKNPVSYATEFYVSMSLVFTQN